MSIASPRTVVVVGNPRPASRTLTAAQRVIRELTGAEPQVVIDLADYASALLGADDAIITDFVGQVAEAELVVVASPTYKASYTGLLKLFLDRFAAGQIQGVAVPLMLGGGPDHALAVEFTLVPLLRHLGAIVPTAGLYVQDRDYDDPSAYDGWLLRARPVIEALVHASAKDSSA